MNHPPLSPPSRTTRWNSAWGGLCAAVLGLAGFTVSAQQNINAGGVDHTQDFNTLTSGAWSDGATLTGWYARTTATASITAYGANTGSTTTAGLYAFGVAGTNPLSDRALGFATSNTFTGTAGTGKGYLGWRLKNNTGTTITSLTVTWTGEQWRKDNASTHSLLLFYQQGTTVTDLVAGSWTDASSTFASPNPGTGGVLDGNATGNRTVGISVNIAVSIPNGEEIMLRWEDLNDSGSDHMLTIDDVTVNATVMSSCGITLGTITTTCNANTPGVDTYDLAITYTGLDAGTTVVNNSGSGTVGGDDPASVSNGTIVISGITEGSNYDVTFTSPCDNLTVSGTSPSCVPACGITLGTITATCNTITAGPGDTYDLSIAYSGSQAGVVVSNNSGSGTLGGDDPAVTANGTITITGISEADAYDVAFSAPCGALSASGAAPNCEPTPVMLWENPITGTNPNTANPYMTGQNVHANITVSGIGRGTGINGANANNRYAANNWGTTFNTDKYFTWTLTPNSGYEIDLTTFVYTGQVSSNINTFAFRSSVDGFATDIGSPTATGTTIDLSGAAYQDITGSIEFRLYAWGSSVAAGNTFSVNDFIFSGYVEATGPTCGISLGTITTTCNANTPGVDTYDLAIPYTGLDAGTTVVNNSGSGTVGGDDPASVSNGTIVISGITEGTNYDVTFTSPCDNLTVSGTSPSCVPACGITLGTITATCNTITAGPGDTYDLSIAYSGSQAGVVVSNNSGSGTLGGDDPAVTANGTITITGISEADAYDVAFSAPCGALTASGAAPVCEPAPSLTTISFDVAGNWTAGSVALTSYATDHLYAESDWSFTGGPGLRTEIATLADGTPTALDVYAWRLNQNVTTDWRATYNGNATVTQFGFKVRRWDGSPEVNAEVRYSTDGGTTFSAALVTINNTFLDGSSAWKSFSYTIPGAVQLAPGNLVVQVVRTVASGERMMIDDFFFDTGAVACALSLGSASTSCDAFTENTDTYTVTIPYTGVQAGASVVNNSGSGTIGGDDPGTVSNGSIIVSGITEGTGYSITFTAPCETIVVSGTSPVCLPPPSLVINEVDYDQPGADTEEFIELKNTGGSAVELGGLKLELWNGNSNSVYATITLPSFSLSAGGHYIVGSSTVPGVGLVAFTTDGIQNGAPDGIRLLTAENDIIDQLSYEGDMPTTEGSGAGTDPNGSTGVGLSRLPDGADSGDNSADFVLTCITPGAANTFVDSDNDGTPDCIDVCPGQPEPGSPCDDGNPLTGNDTMQNSCICAGVALDCEGTPGGTALPGTDCDDGNPSTVDDVYQPDCTCAGVPLDCFGVPGGPDMPGAPCNDLDPHTNDEVYDLSCNCVGTPCSQNVVLDIRSDANSDQVSWEILYQNDGTVVCSGSGYQTGITEPIVEPCCLPIGCFRLRVYDSGGDGFVTGGYQLRESGVNGRRIIDNFGNFTNGGVSAIGTAYDNGAFCVPMGNDKLIYSSCDKLDWVNNKFIVATENVDVSAQYGMNNANSGYEFWFFDPNGGYNFRRFRSHATSDGYGTGALRACHFKVNGWVNGGATPHIPANTLLNVRIRGRVAGTNLPFGAACLFKIDPILAACPRVKLQDDPANTSDYSCGVIREFGGASRPANRIYANPPQPVPAVASSNVRYQFRFRIPGEGICIVRPPQKSAQLVLNWTTGTLLQCSKIYTVDVRVSLNGGATWCFGPATVDQATACADTEDWGKLCDVTIAGCEEFQGGGNALAAGLPGSVTLYPNPNQGDQLFVNITQVDETDPVNLVIYDLTGKRVAEQRLVVADGQVNTTLQLNGTLSNGVYVVHLNAGQMRHTERLVIQR